MNQIIWLTIASGMAFIGAVWQCIIAGLAGIDSMRSFLGAHNSILQEEQDRIRREVPMRRWLKRRRLYKTAQGEANVTLTDQEKRLSRAFDHQARAWSFVVAGTLIAFIASGFQAST